MNAVKDTEVLLLQLDKTGQELMRPLLMNPLRQAYRAVVRSAGGAASGLWEVEVWPGYDKIKDRYPFNLASTRDASFEDAVAFFKPKDGTLWGFYDKYLKGFHYQVSHDFYPMQQLQDDTPGAKASTPFKTNLYNCLKRTHEITDALFVTGEEKPKVSFSINLKTVSPIVSEVVFDIDGQVRRYRNEKEFWYTFDWPGKNPDGREHPRARRRRPRRGDQARGSVGHLPPLRDRHRHGAEGQRRGLHRDLADDSAPRHRGDGGPSDPREPPVRSELLPRHELPAEHRRQLRRRRWRRRQEGLKPSW
jgi:type VI protein secretion system component VasK